MQAGLWAIAAGLILGLLGGYGGALHPMGDALAVFRWQLVLVLAVLGAFALALRLRGLGAVSLIVAGLAGGPLWLAYQPGDPVGELRLYQKNMWFRNDDLAGLEADIRAVAPDAVTLQEVSKVNRALLVALADAMPHQLYCPFETVGGTAVLTRLQPVPGAAVCAKGLTAMQVEGPRGRIWLVSIHLHWPWPFGQAAHLDVLVPVLAGLDGPVVVAGDFNMVPWSQAVRRVAAAARVRLAGPVHGTLPRYAPFAVLPIDQVLAPSGGATELRPRLGSDHFGLLARVGL